MECDGRYADATVSRCSNKRLARCDKPNTTNNVYTTSTTCILQSQFLMFKWQDMRANNYRLEASDKTFQPTDYFITEPS